MHTQVILQQTKKKAHLPNYCNNFKRISNNKQMGRVGYPALCRARRKHWVLQNAVEGTHRDLIQAVLTLNHWTTLLTGSAAYRTHYTSILLTAATMEGLQQMTRYLFLLIMCQGTLWSCHNISLSKTSFLLIPQTSLTIHFELVLVSL